MHRRTREVRNSETTMKVQNPNPRTKNPNPSQEENGGGAYQGLLPVRTQATAARARTKTGGAQSKIEPPLAGIRRGSGARARAPPSGRSTAARSRSGKRARRRGGRRRRPRYSSHPVAEPSHSEEKKEGPRIGHQASRRMEPRSGVRPWRCRLPRRRPPLSLRRRERREEEEWS